MIRLFFADRNFRSNAKFPGDRGPAFASSSTSKFVVTGVWHFLVRGARGPIVPCSWWASARASFLVVPVPWSVIPLSFASAAAKTAAHPSLLTKNLLHTHCGSRKAETHPSRHPPSMSSSLVGVAVAMSRALSSTGAITTDQALFLRSSSRLQLWQPRLRCEDRGVKQRWLTRSHREPLRASKPQLS